MDIEKIELTAEIERRVALASIRLGQIVIRGVAVWKSPQGKLRVFWPSYKRGHGFEDAIALPSDLKSDVAALVIAAYKDAKDKVIEKENLDAKTIEERKSNQ